MIEHLTVKVAAALVGMAVLAAGSLLFGARQASALEEDLHQRAEALARALDALSRQDEAGRVRLTGEGGAIPGTLRGRPYVLQIERLSVAVLAEGVASRAPLSLPIAPELGLGSGPWSLSSESGVWGVRLPWGGELRTTVEVE